VTATEVGVLFNPASQQAAFSTSLPAGCIEFISLSCALGDLAPGASRSVTVPFARVGTGDMTVDVGAGSASVRWDVPVQPRADIKLELSAPESVVIGTDVTVGSTITNPSSGIAYGAAIRYSIPPEVQVISRPDACTGTALTLVCPLGDIGSQRATLSAITVRPTQEGAFTVLAAAIWARDDPTPDDTRGQLTVAVTAPEAPPGPPTAPAPAPIPAIKAVSAGTLAVGMPASGRCIHTRRLNIVLRSIGNADPVRATVRVTGRRHALVLKGPRAQQPFVLRLPRSGKVKVSLNVTLDNGRRYSARRTFRLC
jgi:hypothetical protein